MKNTQLLLIALFISVITFAQNGINYKALIKNTNGQIIANQSIDIQFQILESGTTNVYQETHNPTTDANGIIIVNIGEGTLDSGNFLLIDWSANDHFLNVQVNTGSGLVDLGTTQFKSVPYAKVAEKVNTLPLTNPKYPNGFIGATPVTINLDTNNYTVPAGKNLYITNLLMSGSLFSVTRNSTLYNLATGNFNARSIDDYEKVLTNPILLKSNDLIASTGTFSRINGYLIDSGGIESILINPTFGNDFVVPTGKMFVILNFWSPEQTGILINGINVYSSKNNARLFDPNEFRFFHSFENPIFANEGDIIRSGGSSPANINGYLIDKD